MVSLLESTYAPASYPWSSTRTFPSPLHHSMINDSTERQLSRPTIHRMPEGVFPWRYYDAGRPSAKRARYQESDDVSTSRGGVLDACGRSFKQLSNNSEAQPRSNASFRCENVTILPSDQKGARSDEHRLSFVELQAAHGVGSASVCDDAGDPDSISMQDEDMNIDDTAPEKEAATKSMTPAELRAYKRKLKRFRLTHSQTRYLMSEFARQPHPDIAQRERLADEIPGLSPRQVQVWFQNRRAKMKRLTTDDRERVMRSRALPANFDMTHALQSPLTNPRPKWSPLLPAPAEFDQGARPANVRSSHVLDHGQIPSRCSGDDTVLQACSGVLSTESLSTSPSIAHFDHRAREGSLATETFGAVRTSTTVRSSEPSHKHRAQAKQYKMHRSDSVAATAESTLLSLNDSSTTSQQGDAKITPTCELSHSDWPSSMFFPFQPQLMPKAFNYSPAIASARMQHQPFESEVHMPSPYRPSPIVFNNASPFANDMAQEYSQQQSVHVQPNAQQRTNFEYSRPTAHHSQSTSFISPVNGGFTRAHYFGSTVGASTAPSTWQMRSSASVPVESVDNGGLGIDYYRGQ